MVEDNGEGINAASTDKLTWGIYQPSGGAWVPKDAEREDDNGAGLSWLATDSERSDDVAFLPIRARSSDVRVLVSRLILSWTSRMAAATSRFSLKDVTLICFLQSKEDLDKV